ncbi:hypothetical protein D3C87_574130 [compost metagenome]
MNKNIFKAIEELAGKLDGFNGSKMMVGNQVNEEKSIEFSSIIINANRLGFKSVLPKNKVMELLYNDSEEVMVSIDCDDEKVIINTTMLWKFIEQQEVLSV